MSKSSAHYSYHILRKLESTREILEKILKYEI